MQFEGCSIPLDVFQECVYFFYVVLDVTLKLIKKGAYLTILGNFRRLAGFGPLAQLEQGINGLREGARKANKYRLKIRVFVLTYPNVLASSCNFLQSPPA
jgi:hypothetical protein